LDINSPPERAKPKNQSESSAGFEITVGDPFKPPVETSCSNIAGNHRLAWSTQLAIKDEEFDYMVSTYTATLIVNNQEDSIQCPQFASAVR